MGSPDPLAVAIGVILLVIGSVLLYQNNKPNTSKGKLLSALGFVCFLIGFGTVTIQFELDLSGFRIF